jgi:2'-5' RNA ligase
MEALLNYPQQPYFKGSIVKEYLLVVNPEGDVQQELIEERSHFSKVYKTIVATETKPHIMVANFLAKEEMEETVLRWMHRIISSQKSFTVALNNYSGFPNTNSVYIRVQNHQPFKQLSKELKIIDELVRDNGLPKANLIVNPYIVIAGRLDTSVYETAMPVYSKKDFHAEFEVKELLLLKRTHEFNACKQVSIFRLQ